MFPYQVVLVDCVYLPSVNVYVTGMLLEIGLLRASSEGRVLGKYTTLINVNVLPGTDLACWLSDNDYDMADLLSGNKVDEGILEVFEFIGRDHLIFWQGVGILHLVQQVSKIPGYTDKALGLYHRGCICLKSYLSGMMQRKVSSKLNKELSEVQVCEGRTCLDRCQNMLRLIELYTEIKESEDESADTKYELYEV